ncbi:hypothetical protein [Legionella parisiensis]|uniref:Coiled-coil protein n=1 Tax=Legionella parisiensis TaxID=45071 RepID=A0A1E5JSW2_9GAMM|nr:hypothetical protein [Legionella parisiensis]KTD40599.1 coiled-coil protein [Legionella parisiensis]OEH47617.1 hypothetical protein lpari_01377 [Legionella parisiensis]STX77008.1 coiled-coil protein [Legionella parisiensis]
MLSRTVWHARTRCTNRTISVGGNTHIVRYYSQYNWKQFNDGSCDIASVLESGKGSYPEVFSDPSVEFTALKYSVQKKDELALKQKGFGRYKGHNGQSIGDLLLFEPPRRSLQITGALIPLLLKTPAQNNDFGVFVRNFHREHILPVIPQISMVSERQKYLNWVYDVLQDPCKQKHLYVHMHFTKLKAELLKRKEKGVIDGSDPMLTELAMIHLADEFLKGDIDKRIYTLSERVIETLLKQAKYESLPLVSAMKAQTFIGVQEEAPKSYPDRFTVLMAGGPGSGKSITTESFALQLQQQTGYALDELALLTVDRKRTIYYGDECVKGAQKKYIGALTHDEAVVTYNMSGEFLTRRMDKHKRVPNVFKEMCNIWPKWLDIGLKKDGTYLITISTRKPENAVDGVIQRGISNNDFITPPEYVLNSYRSVSERFPLVIQENQSKKVIISVVNNELAIVKKFSKEKGKDSQESGDNKPAIVVDCETNTIYVINLLQYVDFINQSQLNSKATSADELFKGADISIATSVARVIDPSKFGSARIAFVRQGVTSTSINNLKKNIVATVQDGALDVQAEADFAELKSDAPEHFEVLESLTSQNSLQTATK